MYNRLWEGVPTIIKESIASALSIVKIILPKYFELIKPLLMLLLPVMELLELPDEFTIV